jgi:hypothetical protein
MRLLGVIIGLLAFFILKVEQTHCAQASAALTDAQIAGTTGLPFVHGLLN